MCAECWHDAGMETMLLGGSKVDVYRRLVAERQDDVEHVARNTTTRSEVETPAEAAPASEEPKGAET